MECKIERIKRDLEALAGFNRTPGEGCTRLSYTEEFKQAAGYLKKEMAAAGLDVREDAAGNLIGRYPGKTQLPAVMAGSHFDTVYHGGNFDGAAGVCAAIEAARVMSEHQFVPSRPIEIVAMAEEEGARFGGGLLGSRAVCSGLDTDDLKRIRDADGITLYQALKDYGIDPEKIANARRRSEELAAFIELHIEQGPVLEQHGRALGIVDAIVGLQNFEIRIHGRADHAGTTPFEMRADALLAAARAITAATDQAQSCRDGSVVTFGCIQSQPGSSNVVPSQVRLTADCRSPHTASIRSIMQSFTDSLEQSRAGAPDLSWEITQTLQAEPAVMDPRLKQWLEDAAAEWNLPTMHLLSGAGHDAMNFGVLCPTAMIFVPSRSGRSHCPEEWTDYRLIAGGANVLLHVLQKMAVEL